MPGPVQSFDFPDSQKRGGQLVQPYQNVQQVAFDFWAKPVLQNQDGTYYCPGFEGKTFQDNPWSVVYFAGNPTPGLAEVTVARERSFDEKKPAGTDGARVTLHGTNPARIEIRLLIWTPEQLRQLNLLWPKLMVPPYKTQTVVSFPQIQGSGALGFNGTQSVQITGIRLGGGVVAGIVIPQATTVSKTVSTPITFDVYHPALVRENIKKVQIIGGRGPDPGQVVNSRMFTISVIEHLPPGNKNVATTDPPANGSALDQGNYPTPGSFPANTGP